jgi:hypothetical protein
MKLNDLRQASPVQFHKSACKYEPNSTMNTKTKHPPFSPSTTSSGTPRKKQMPGNKQASFVCVGLLALLVTVGATANPAITYPSDDLRNFGYLWGGAEAALNSKVVNGDGSVTFDVNMATNDYGKVALGIDTLKDWSTADILYLKVTLDSASGISGADAPLGIELNPFVNPSGDWVEDKDLMLLGLQDESAYHASLVEPPAANQLNWAR